MKKSRNRRPAGQLYWSVGMEDFENQEMPGKGFGSSWATESNRSKPKTKPAVIKKLPVQPKVKQA